MPEKGLACDKVHRKESQESGAQDSVTDAPQSTLGRGNVGASQPDRPLSIPLTKIPLLQVA